MTLVRPAATKHFLRFFEPVVRDVFARVGSIGDNGWRRVVQLPGS